MSSYRSVLQWEVALTGVLFAAEAILSLRLFRRLRRDHRELWEELGRPRSIVLPDFRSPFWKYIWERGYRNHGDAALRREAELSRRLGYSLIIGFFLGVILGFLDGFT
ncbi:MAG: hypothetical protein K8F56_04585 [Rhodocyclaceae bacterium]|nr:hypothetical protein [Rhodocyclaceae bacterium]